MTRIEPATDTSSAEWIVSGLQGFAESVLSLVPPGFTFYVRIFHPAYRRDGDQLVCVRWSEIAAANGREYHAGMQLTSLTGSFDSYRNGQAGVFDVAPQIGSLPPELAEPLAALLGRRAGGTTWFAFWEGFAGLRADITAAPAFSVPNRTYHLLSGPVAAVAESAWTIGHQSPNLWWPDDRAWCAATEIDLNTTYVASVEESASAILEDGGLEALPIDPKIGIAFDSDTLNPLPDT